MTAADCLLVQGYIEGVGIFRRITFALQRQLQSIAGPHRPCKSYSFERRQSNRLSPLPRPGRDRLINQMHQRNPGRSVRPEMPAKPGTVNRHTILNPDAPGSYGACVLKAPPVDPKLLLPVLFGLIIRILIHTLFLFTIKI